MMLFTHAFTYVCSDGGIMGTVYMSLTTDVQLGCIGVGGGPFGLLVRSRLLLSLLPAYAVCTT